MSYADTLYARGPEFDFFQAVRILELFAHDPADPAWQPVEDVARFRALQSLSFPPSAIYSVEPQPAGRRISLVTVNFIGIPGPQWALPATFQHMLLMIAR